MLKALRCSISRNARKRISSFNDESTSNPKTLQYIMDTANRIIAHPDWYDTKVDFYGTDMYARFIYQMGSDLKYTAEAVFLNSK